MQEINQITYFRNKPDFKYTYSHYLAITVQSFK